MGLAFVMLKNDLVGSLAFCEKVPVRPTVWRGATLDLGSSGRRNGLGSLFPGSVMGEAVRNARATGMLGVHALSWWPWMGVTAMIGVALDVPLAEMRS